MKKNFSKLFVHLGIDSLFRWINKNRLLIIAYHGICNRDECPNLFTHLPVDIFHGHLQFLKKHYNLISLKDLSQYLSGARPYPERTALITFDDGFMNNYSVAFPILKEHNIPATIFLTTDYVGTQKILWFDELYLLIRSAIRKGISNEKIKNIFAIPTLPRTDEYNLYSILSRKLKYINHEIRHKNILELSALVGPIEDPLAKNFNLLTWEQIHEMKKSGLIDFGVHTANHRIISQVSEDEWEKEIIFPKKKLSSMLNCETNFFCYPNGIPDVDFTPRTEEYLAQAGYVGAFSTGEWLNSWGEKLFRLGRKPAGNDVTSNIFFFRLNTSGFMDTARQLAASCKIFMK